MGSVAETNEPLRLAVKAVVIKAIQQGRNEASRELGVGVRTINNWMRTWGFGPRSRPDPMTTEELEEMLRYLGIDLQIHKEEVHASCSLVQEVTAMERFRREIDCARKALASGDVDRAMDALHAISVAIQNEQPQAAEMM